MINTVVGGLESKLSDQLWQSFSLALAKPNNYEKTLKNSNTLANIENTKNAVEH
jgi:hypothetical protein